MSDDYWNARNQGALGNARPVGGGPRAWQGYDQGRAERERQQQAASATSRMASTSSSIPDTGPSTADGSGSDVSLDGIVLLIFMGLFTWAAVAVNAHFEWAGSGPVILGSLVFSYFLGILILRLLKVLFLTIVALSVLGGLGYLGWDYLSASW